MASRTLDGSLGVAIISLQGEGTDHEPDPEGTFLLGAKGDILIGLQQTGEQAEIELKHPESRLFTLRFAPDGSWLSFNRPDRTTGAWPLFIAHVENGQPTEYDKWIQITQDSVANHPWWSPDGNTLYFRSNRDEYTCIWAQPLDPTTKKPRGPLKPIRHFHERVRTDGVGGGKFGYGMTNDRLYFPLSEPKANIWLAEPQTKP